MYVYFNHNPKKNIKRWKLVEIMETKGFKIFGNIKTTWIKMVATSKLVLEKLKIVLMKIPQDFYTNESTTMNFELLCDIVPIIVYLCDPYVGSCAKFEQVFDKILIYDFVSIVKLCQVDLHNMYCDEEKKYKYINFPQF